MKDKKILHDVLLPNFGTKLLSIIGAIIAWVVIINIDDPSRTKTFQVPVEVINENAIASVNKVYEITSGDIARVRVTGKRSIIDKLDVTDIRATADLSNLSSVNAVSIEPSLRKKVSDEVVLQCSDMLKLFLEDRARKQMKITIETEGSPADGYSIGECVAKPNMIEISGGESTIDRIETVRVIMNVDGASEDFSKKLVPVAYDAQGKIVNSTTLSYSDTKIRVKAKVLATKSIPVEVKIIGTPAKNYRYVGTECVPEQLQVAGSAKNLSNISKLEIPIDISGYTDTSSRLEQTIRTEDYLSDGISVAQGYEEISIKITIEALVTRTLHFDPDEITMKDLPKKYQARIVKSNGNIAIRIRGLASALNTVPDSSFYPYINCEDASEGEKKMTVKLDLNQDIEIISSDKVYVKFTLAKETEQETPTQNPTETPVGSKPAQETATPLETMSSDEE